MAEKSYFKIGKQIYKMDLSNNRSMFGDIVVIELEAKNTWIKKFKNIE